MYWNNLPIKKEKNLINKHKRRQRAVGERPGKRVMKGKGEGKGDFGSQGEQ